MKAPTITTSMDRPVNLLRATTTCNAFYIFLSAAKAALFPFLTLFFRIIGLSAMETGVVMAAKTLTGFVWAPLWARCAVAYNKRRVVLIFSLLMMGTMYMSFTGVYYKVGSLQACHPAPVLGHQDGNMTSSKPGTVNGSLASNGTQNSGPGASVEEPVVPDHVPVSLSEGNGEVNNSLVNESNKSEGVEHPAHRANTSKSEGSKPGPEVSKESPSEPSEEHHDSSSSVLPSSTPKAPTSTAVPAETESGGTHQQQATDVNLEALREVVLKETGRTLRDIVESGDLSDSEMYRYARLLIPDMKKADFQNLLDKVKHESADSNPHSTHRSARYLNLTVFNGLKDRFGILTATLEEKKLLLFFVVLLIIIFGEFFSSPVEKVADDAWFDFLERIDDMEKYGRQRYWGSLTFALVPIVVTCIVDYTPCKMMFNLHHFLMHFFVFGIFIIFTLCVAFFFPMPPPVKHKYSSKVCKGLRVICCDGRGFLFVITLLMAGSVYASFNNFLFWHLQDLGGREVTMGLCVSIGAFAETPMLIFSNKLVRKLGHGGLVSLSLIVLAVRVLYYGFLWTPWAVLPVEVTNAFTHTALWYAVLSYDEFNVGSAMDRSIRSILSSIYFGLGFSVGSFVSGVVYHVYGAPVLFWGASVLSGSWCLFYSLIQCCLPKKERVKYIKLLRKEEDDSSEGDDDWLEMALKDQ